MPSSNPFGRGYPCLIGCFHRYHTIGGENGTTMVVMFVGLLCWDLHYILYYSYCRNPTAQECFVSAGTLIAIKLLKPKSILAGTKNSCSEDFLLAKNTAHKHPYHDELFPPPEA